MYLTLIFFIFFVTCILAFLEKGMQNEKYILYIVLGILLICIAAFRPEGMDNDFDTYVSYILNNDHPYYQIIVEPSFMYISKVFMNFWGDYRSVFILYALMGVTLKMYAIQRLSPLLFLPICIYIGNFFILHEFTQIRVGVAVGLIMIATSFISQGQKKKAFFLTACATLFHYSSLAFIPIIFLSNDNITLRKRILWSLLIPVGYCLYFINIRITVLPIPILEEKLGLYQDLKDSGFIDEANVFNVLILIKIAILYYCIYFYDIIQEHIPCFGICIKLMAISIFCFISLTDLPVLAFRISELFGFAEIILFSSIIYTVKPQWIGTLATCTLGLTLLCLHAFIDDILVIM